MATRRYENMVFQVKRHIDVLEERITRGLEKKRRKTNLELKLMGDPAVSEAINNIRRSYEIADFIKNLLIAEVQSLMNSVGYLPDPFSKPERFTEVRAVCPNPHGKKISQTVAKGLFDYRVPIDNVRWTKSNLIYIKEDTIDRLVIDNDRVLCNICPKKRKISTRKEKGGDYFFFRKDFDPDLALVQVMASLKNEHGMSLKMIESTIRRSNELGFNSLISALERAKLSRVSYFGFPQKTHAGLSDVIERFIPGYNLIIRCRSKLSIADKYILIHYLANTPEFRERSFDDFIGLRLIMPEVNDCYNAYREIGKSEVFSKLSRKDYHDFIANPKKNKYQSIHDTLLVDADILNEVIGRHYDIKDPFIRECVYNCRVELQIRTNEMDNNAELESRQRHGIYKKKQIADMNKLLKKRGMFEKANLIRALLTPERISYNNA